MKDEIDKECIIDHVEHIAEKDYSEYVRGEFVPSILDWLLAWMDMVPSVLLYSDGNVRPIGKLVDLRVRAIRAF